MKKKERKEMTKEEVLELELGSIVNRIEHIEAELAQLRKSRRNALRLLKNAEKSAEKGIK